jgi:hypothetical protein
VDSIVIGFCSKSIGEGEKCLPVIKLLKAREERNDQMIINL